MVMRLFDMKSPSFLPDQRSRGPFRRSAVFITRMSAWQRDCNTCGSRLLYQYMKMGEMRGLPPAWPFGSISRVGSLFGNRGQTRLLAASRPRIAVELPRMGFFGWTGDQNQTPASRLGRTIPAQGAQNADLSAIALAENRLSQSLACFTATLLKKIGDRQFFEFDGPIQRKRAIMCPCIDVSTFFNEQFGGLFMAVASSTVQRGLVVFVSGINLSTMLDEQPKNVW